MYGAKRSEQYHKQNTIKNLHKTTSIRRLKLQIYTNLDLPLAHKSLLCSAELGLQTSEKCRQNN